MLPGQAAALWAPFARDQIPAHYPRCCPVTACIYRSEEIAHYWLSGRGSQEPCSQRAAADGCRRCLGELQLWGRHAMNDNYANTRKDRTAVAGLTSRNAQVVLSADLAMDLIAWFVIVPLCFASLLTGLVSSLGTPLGLFRHYWIGSW